MDDFFNDSLERGIGITKSEGHIIVGIQTLVSGKCNEILSSFRQLYLPITSDAIECCKKLTAVSNVFIRFRLSDAKCRIR